MITIERHAEVARRETRLTRIRATTARMEVEARAVGRELPSCARPCRRAEAMWRMLQQPAPDDCVIATGETHAVRKLYEICTGQLGDIETALAAILDWIAAHPEKIDRQPEGKP